MSEAKGCSGGGKEKKKRELRRQGCVTQWYLAWVALPCSCRC